MFSSRKIPVESGKSGLSTSVDKVVDKLRGPFPQKFHNNFNSN